MSEDKRIKLDEASLEFILNFTLENLKEDRRLALEHHTILSSLLSGQNADGEDLSGIEIQMIVQELSGALTNFLKSAATSTEQGLKMAKILSDLLTKIDTDTILTDEDRASIEEMVGGFEDEKQTLEVLENVIALDTIVKDES